MTGSPTSSSPTSACRTWTATSSCAQLRARPPRTGRACSGARAERVRARRRPGAGARRAATRPTSPSRWTLRTWCVPWRTSPAARPARIPADAAALPRRMSAPAHPTLTHGGRWRRPEHGHRDEPHRRACRGYHLATLPRAHEAEGGHAHHVHGHRRHAAREPRLAAARCADLGKSRHRARLGVRGHHQSRARSSHRRADGAHARAAVPDRGT